MKILQLVTRRQYRGAEVFAAELSNRLSLRGHEVTFAGLYEAPSNELFAENCNNLDMKGGKGFLNPVLLWRVVRLIKKIKPDIVQANGSDTLKYAILAKYFISGIPVFYRNISMVSAWSHSRSLKRKFNKYLFGKVDFVTSVGQTSLNDLIATYHFPVQKTKLIKRGISEIEIDKSAARRELSAHFGFDNSDKILVHVGNFSPEKNHSFLIDVFERVLEERANVRLIFIGEGSGIADIKSKCVKWKDHIFFLGHIQNVQQFLAGGDLFILGSTIEGVPGVILEAAMQCVPSVAVNVGGVSEVVIDNLTGILLPTHNKSTFADAVLKLLKNESLCKELGRNAKSMVVENYTLEACVRQFENLYYSVSKSENESLTYN